MRAPMIAVDLSVTDRDLYRFVYADDSRLGDTLAPVVMGLFHRPERCPTPVGGGDFAHVWGSPACGDFYVVNDDYATPIRVKRPVKG